MEYEKKPVLSVLKDQLEAYIAFKEKQFVETEKKLIDLDSDSEKRRDYLCKKLDKIDKKVCLIEKVLNMVEKDIKMTN